MKNKKLAKAKITWDEVESDLSLLERKIEPMLPIIKNIYGVPRGGLLLAVMLSHRLNIPIVQERDRIGRNTLIVDDICDSGKTMLKVTKDVKEWKERLEAQK